MNTIEIGVFCLICVYITENFCDNSYTPLKGSSRVPTKFTSRTPNKTLTLPGNSTSIREDISDNFSCENRTYGYYADVENDCQIFHVCLPVTYADGKSRMFKWSFICPEETQFDQENFTCAREEDSIDCKESEKYYDLNRTFGQIDENEEKIKRKRANSTENNFENTNSIEDTGTSLIMKRKNNTRYIFGKP